MNLKSVCLLLSLCHAGSVAALGLGELTVRSHLGQALHVSVKILGANTTVAAGSFSLVSSEGAAVPPPWALLAQGSGREAPVVATQEKAPRSESAPPADTYKAKQTPVAPRQSPSATRPALPRNQTAAQDDQAPRRVQSGRHGVNSAALALRLDTNLPDLSRLHTESLTHDEMSDENTALTHKLAHLEAQLIALQKRNAEIEAKRVGEPANKTPSPSSQSAQWPLYLLIVGLLVAAGVLIAWLRRHSRD